VHPLVLRCNEWMKKGNVPPTTTEADQVPLNACDEFRLFVAAANAAGPRLVRTTLVAGGLPKVVRFESAMVGDGLYRAGKLFGGDYIRAIQWHLDCKCWKVIDRDMKPAH